MQPLFFTTANLSDLEFQTYQKIALIRARQLTEQDVLSYAGIISTLEGPAVFQAGDYLAVGVSGELWPIGRAAFEQTKQAVSPPDAAGFRDYQTIGTIRAAQISQPFTVELASGSVISGKSGDYLAQAPADDLWIVDQQIFKQTYKLI